MRKIVLALFLCLIVPNALLAQELIGVSLPLKGDGAAYGLDILNSLKFANAELLGGRYRLKVEDDECSGSQAVSIAQKFINIDGLKYALGFGCSSVVLSAAPLYERARVVVISSSAASPEISKAGDFIFRTYPSSESGAALLAKYIAGRHKTLGILSEQTEYAQGVLAGMQRNTPAAQVKIIADDFLPGTSDFRTQLTKLKNAGVEALMLNPQAEDRLILLVKEVQQLGWKVPLYSFIYPSSPTFLAAVGAKADGITFADTPGFGDLADAKSKQLFAKFVERYGKPRSSDFYFSTSVVAFQALDQAIQSGENVRDYLATHVFKTIHGDFSFDQYGDPKGIGYVLKEIRGGRPRTLILK